MKFKERPIDRFFRPTILCVDDEPEIIDAIARNLRPYAVNVNKALHGMQGIWRAHTEKTDLIISDLKMPFANGVELIEVLRHIPVIAITGVKDQNAHQRLLDAGAATVLPKPVNFARLLDEIKRFIPLQKRLSATRREKARSGNA